MTQPIYANIIIQTDGKNNELDEEYMKTLTKEKRVNYIKSMEKDTPKTVQLNGVVLPSTDLKLINSTCLKRITKQFDLKVKNFKVISIESHRIINGEGLYSNDYKKMKV